MVELRTAVFLFLEPELFGFVVHGARVEDTVVVDEALPRLVPVARHPIDHVAAVAGAEGAGTVAIEEVVLRQSGTPAGLQILERLAAPVTRDGFGEGLAVTRRTVEVDGHHREVDRGCQKLKHGQRDELEHPLRLFVEPRRLCLQGIDGLAPQTGLDGHRNRTR